MFSATQQLFTRAKHLGSMLTAIEFRRQTAMENAKLGIWERDLVKDIMTWDAEMFEIYGVDHHMFTPSYEGWERRLHPDDLGRVKLDISVLTGEHRQDRYSSAFRIFRNGEWRWVLTTGKAIRDVYGKLIKIVGTNQLIDKNIKIF